MTDYFVWLKVSQICDRDDVSVTLPEASPDHPYGGVTLHPATRSQYADSDMGIFDGYGEHDPRFEDPNYGDNRSYDYELCNTCGHRDCLTDHNLDDGFVADMDAAIDEHFDQAFRDRWGYSRRDETLEQRTTRNRKEEAEWQREQRNHEMGTTNLGSLLAEALLNKARTNDGQAAGLNINTEQNPRVSLAALPKGH